MAEPRTDEDLLAGGPEAFGLFYRRHVTAMLAFFARRTRDAELAADLTAETFAAALAGVHRFDPARGPAAGWLYGIAHRQLAAAARRGRVEDRARRRLGMSRITLTDAALERIDELAGEDVAVAALAGLPKGQREAIRARVLDERDYGDIAARTMTSEAVVRKRVSRGLADLRSRLRETGT